MDVKISLKKTGVKKLLIHPFFLDNWLCFLDLEITLEEKNLTWRRHLVFLAVLKVFLEKDTRLSGFLSKL